MAALIPNLRQQYFDANGEVLAGGKLFSYQAGTSTPLVTYANQDESTENTNPVILDANGQAELFIGSNAYKFVMKDSSDVTLWTVDNVSYLYPDSISTFMLQDGSVTEPKMADNAIEERSIAINAVTEEKIADEAVSREKISLVDRWLPGDMKIHHSFNGFAPIENGWMLCDGRQVNKANYDTEHGPGSWDLHVVSTILLNKYLPNFADKYPVGKSATTQSGASAITSIGNAGNVTNIAHTHTIGNHVHQIVKQNAANTSDQVYNASGALVSVGGSGKGTGFGISVDQGANQSSNQGDAYTSQAGAQTTSSGGSATQTIQPDSIEVQYYMRIV